MLLRPDVLPCDPSGSHIEEGTEMTHYAGIDISLETSNICIVDEQGGICREFKVESEPEVMAAALMSTGFIFSRIGLEAGPLSQWLHAGLTKAALPVVLLETRQLRATNKAMPVKTDRNDARATVPVIYVRTYLQAHRLDTEFYDRHLEPGAYLRTHAEHDRNWGGVHTCRGRYRA
jgi:hypothetical protein